MKPALWKRWLSYLTEVRLEAGSTDLNPDLKLGLRKGRYCLTTPKAIYSYGDLYGNFLRSFHKTDFSKLNIQHVLILGLGLGSIPFILERIFSKSYRYVGVEADELIAQWYSRYQLPELNSPIEVHLGDAQLFVKICQQRFELICMDVFIDDLVPEKFESIDFLTDLRRLLSERGLLLFNRLALRPKDRERCTEFLEGPFKKVFPSAGYIDLGGNWMLVSDTSLLTR